MRDEGTLGTATTARNSDKIIATGKSRDRGGSHSESDWRMKFLFLFFGFENSLLRITFLSVCFFFSLFSFYSCYFSGSSFQILLLENFNSFGKYQCFNFVRCGPS